MNDEEIVKAIRNKVNSNPELQRKLDKFRDNLPIIDNSTEIDIVKVLEDDGFNKEEISKIIRLKIKKELRDTK